MDNVYLKHNDMTDRWEVFVKDVVMEEFDDFITACVRTVKTADLLQRLALLVKTDSRLEVLQPLFTVEDLEQGGRS